MTLSFENEKRLGRERREEDKSAARAFGERRRLLDRRQFAIEDISFFEWASYFAKFYKAGVVDGNTMSKNHPRALSPKTR